MNWSEHVQNFSKKNNMTFGKAMSNKKCRQEWKKMKKGGNPDLVAEHVEPANHVDAKVESAESANLEPNNLIGGGKKMTKKSKKYMRKGGKKSSTKKNKKTAKKYSK